MPRVAVFHATEALSAFAPGPLTPFRPGSFVELVEEIPRYGQLAYQPATQILDITAATYPGTPQLRWPVTPWLGKYLVFMAAYYVLSGSGNFQIKFEVEAPVSTKNTAATFSTSSGLLGYSKGYVDLSTLGGADRRGESGWLNVYLQISGGATGRLQGLSAFYAETATTQYHFF